MSRTAPILLSFYALSNGKSMIAIGQLTYSSLRDFSFKNYGRRKTFRSILALYRTRFFDHEAIELEFDSGTYKTITDEAGSFFLEVSDAAAPEGIRFLTQHMNTPYSLWTCAIDENLNDQFYIVPGLGDAGDLAYGTKL